MNKIWLCLFLCAVPLVEARAEWSASAYFGKAHTSAADLRVISRPTTDVLFRNVGFDDRSFQGPLYYGLRAGYMLTRSTGVETEFIHIKAFSRVNEPVAASGTLPGMTMVRTAVAPSQVIAQYGVSHGLNLLLGNFVLKHELGRHLALTIRPGLGIAIPHPEIRAMGASLEEYQIKGAAVQLAGGGEFELSRHVFWLGEYKFTMTKPRFELGSVVIENSFANHHLVTGVGFRF